MAPPNTSQISNKAQTGAAGTQTGSLPIASTTRAQTGGAFARGEDARRRERAFGESRKRDLEQSAPTAARERTARNIQVNTAKHAQPYNPKQPVPSSSAKPGVSSNARRRDSGITENTRNTKKRRRKRG
jgi:hypothetical protein